MMVARWWHKLVVAGAALAALAGAAQAQNSRIIESEVDPSLFRIDEAKYLGAKPAADIALRDENGKPFTFGEMAGQPLILVLSYYTCDGSCSLVNNDLLDLLKGSGKLTPGDGFRILTVSFDANDTPESMTKFRRALGVPEAWQAGWRFALPQKAEEAKRLADTIGYKYFWSPRDRVFFHPGVFAFFSGEGRVVRYLYAMNTSPKDVELALMDARGDQVRLGEIVDYALSLCYSYNYMQGRYTFNIVVIVGVGSFVLGIFLLVVSVFAFRRRRRRGEVI